MGDRVGDATEPAAADHARAYRPLALILGLLALLIAVLPSVDQRVGTSAASGGDAALGNQGGVSAETPGAATAGDAAPTGDAAAGVPGGGSGAVAGPGGASAAGGSEPAVFGDTSHCVGDRQFDFLEVNPPCFRSFSGDNGGGTHRGVSAKVVKVLFFQLQLNEQVAAVFGTQESEENEVDVFMDTILPILNEHYELYGRRVEFDAFESQCPQTPPNVPLCIEEARKAMALEPFVVVSPEPLYPAVHDEFARNGYVTVGGWHYDASHFTQRRPFRYGVLMDGTQSMEVLAEFYCKQMAGKGASHSGRVIHPTIGTRGTQRRVGILVQDDDARIRPAQHLANLIARCNGAEKDPVLAKYSTDIERAPEQAASLAVKMIEEKVTTIVCSCDSIAPVFLLPVLTSANYYPEHLMAGTGTTDLDSVARLYDPTQWVHAFGLSHFGETKPDAELDATILWTMAGQQGVPCDNCVFGYIYLRMIMDMVQAAGPNLNPLTLESGALGLPDNGHQTIFSPLRRLGSGDYTEWSDVKAVYWDPEARSKSDGTGGGAYITVSKGRFRTGGVQGGLMAKIPPASQ